MAVDRADAAIGADDRIGTGRVLIKIAVARLTFPQPLLGAQAFEFGAGAGGKDAEERTALRLNRHGAFVEHGEVTQDIAGGASSLVGQDIIGGAAIAFKRPPRVRDLSGGASVLIVRRRPRPTEIARNNPPKPPRPGTPEPQSTPTAISDEDRVEAYNNQGNTFYDVGQYAKAIEAYKTA